MEYLVGRNANKTFKIEGSVLSHMLSKEFYDSMKAIFDRIDKPDCLTVDGEPVQIFNYVANDQPFQQMILRRLKTSGLTFHRLNPNFQKRKLDSYLALLVRTVLCVDFDTLCYLRAHCYEIQFQHLWQVMELAEEIKLEFKDVDSLRKRVDERIQRDKIQVLDWYAYVRNTVTENAVLKKRCGIEEEDSRVEEDETELDERKVVQFKTPKIKKKKGKKNNKRNKPMDDTDGNGLLDFTLNNWQERKLNNKKLANQPQV